MLPGCIALTAPRMLAPLGVWDSESLTAKPPKPGGWLEAKLLHSHEVDQPLEVTYRSEGACQGALAGAAQRRFWLAPTADTLKLATRPLNVSLVGLPPLPAIAFDAGCTAAEVSAIADRTAADQRFDRASHHNGLAHMLLRQLALHPSCTNSQSAADICVILAPANGRCYRWEAICPGKRLVVIDAGPSGSGDLDLISATGAGPIRLCRSLWERGASTWLTRVVANPPALLQRFDCGYATSGTLSIPLLSHARRTGNRPKP